MGKFRNGSAIGSRKVWAEVDHIDLRIGVERRDEERQVYLTVVIPVWDLPTMDDEPLCIAVFQTFPRQAEIVEVALIRLR
jgi:hypothetical protein